MLPSLLKIKLRALSLCAALSLFSINQSFAQANNHSFACGADAYWEAKTKQNPALRVQQRELLTQMAGNEKVRRKDEQADVRIIPVVFHILHTYGNENITRQRVLDQLKTLNETFNAKNTDLSGVRTDYKSLVADTKIEFRLATKDPNGNCTDGIVRKYSSLTEDASDNVKKLSYWNSDKYLNIWVVSSINDFGEDGTILGYAQFPWDNDKTTDGIVIRADQVTTNNKTLTHEIGHYLGLMHTFESAMGPGCGRDCSTSGDWICDTPPSTGPTPGCPAATYNTCKSDFPDMPDMFENFMDYSSCSRMFTHGQKERMDDNLISTRRANLITSANLIATGTADLNVSTCKPVADFYATKYVVCEGSTVTFKDNSYNATPSAYEWKFVGGSPAIATVKDPVIRFDKAGIYPVTLQVSTAAGTSTVERTAYIKVLPATSTIKTPILEEFEDFSPQQSGYEFSTDFRGVKWNVTTAASAKGDRSLYINNLSAEEGETYYVTLPPVDMTQASTKNLTFDVAYARLGTSTNDELRVQVSSNCGQSFTGIYFKSGTRLATTTDLKTTAFVPKENEWRKEEVSLSSYKNTQNLIIRFAFKSAGGNNAYIDNINIGQAWATGIEDDKHFSEGAHMEIYPNPAASDFKLRTAAPERNATIEVFDASGKQLRLLNGLNLSPEQPLNLNKAMLNIQAGGVYYIKLHTSTATFVEKLIISQ